MHSNFLAVSTWLGGRAGSSLFASTSIFLLASLLSESKQFEAAANKRYRFQPVVREVIQNEIQNQASDKICGAIGS
jgi:hypothetical protein